MGLSGVRQETRAKGSRGGKLALWQVRCVHEEPLRHGASGFWAFSSLVQEMNCPECGGDMRVADSRPRDGGVWRRRKCAAGHTVYTIETQTDPPVIKVGRVKDEVRKEKKPSEA